MAHNLNFNETNNDYSFFGVKQKAWHGLGKIVDTAINSSEAIILAGLNFEVAKAPVFSNLNLDNQQFSISDKFATYRTDTNDIFGIVGSNYEIVQNTDAFSFFDSIVGKGAAIYETAGCLNKGEIIFITAKLPDFIRVGNADLIEQYLFLTSSHDGKGAVQAAFTPIRIVCNNTLNAALKHSSNKISIRHTANAKSKLEQAHKIMGISHIMSQELELVFNQMAKTKINDLELKELIKKALSPNVETLNKIDAGEELTAHFKKSVDDCFEYSLTAESQLLETTKGTLFGAYNAVTGYFQNVKEFKNEETKLKNIINGVTKQKAQIAFDLCVSQLN